MCGTAASCDGNAAVSTCDAAANQCVCGTAGMGDTSCLDGETCMGGTTCMCGAGGTCAGNNAADGCDGTSCTCGGKTQNVSPMYIFLRNIL